jgi:hypothetical protein
MLEQRLRKQRANLCQEHSGGRQPGCLGAIGESPARFYGSCRRDCVRHTSQLLEFKRVSRSPRRFQKPILAFILLSLVLAAKCRGQVIVTWDANTNSSTAGYYLVWGASKGVYTVTNVYSSSLTSALIYGLATNQVYYFNLAAFNSSGNTSPYVGEIAFTNVYLPTNSTNPGGGNTNTQASEPPCRCRRRRQGRFFRISMSPKMAGARQSLFRQRRPPLM